MPGGGGGGGGGTTAGPGAADDELGMHDVLPGAAAGGCRRGVEKLGEHRCHFLVVGIHGADGGGEEAGQLSVAVADDVQVVGDVRTLLFQASDRLYPADVVAAEDPLTPRVAVLDLHSQGTDDQTAATLTGVLLSGLADGGGIELLSNADLRNMLTLEDEAHRYVIHAAIPAELPTEAGLRLTDVRVEQRSLTTSRRIDADHATIEVARGAIAGLQIDLAHHPEPSVMLLQGLGFLILAGRRRR